MSDSEDIIEEEQEYGVSYKEDLSRVGIGEYSGKQVGRGEEKERLTPEERFIKYVEGISRKIKEYGSITEKDVRTIIELSNNPDMKNLNPTAFILGYLSTKILLGSGKTNSVRHVIENILPLVDDDGSITPPDVVRYYKYMKNKV